MKFKRASNVIMDFVGFGLLFTWGVCYEASKKTVLEQGSLRLHEAAVIP